MDKDFDQWNIQKKNIEASQKNVFFKEGDVWWCSVGVNIGSESCGKGTQFQRPVLIIKKLSKVICIALPLSKKIKKGTWFMNMYLGNEKRTILLYQIKMLHTKRFQRRLAHIDLTTLIEVKQKLKFLLKLDHHQEDLGSVGNPKSGNSIS